MLRTYQRSSRVGTRHWSGSRAIRVFAAAMTAGGLVGLSVACASDEGDAGSPPAGARTPSAAAFAECMRANGVPGFPDPDANGRIMIQPGQGFDPNTPQFQAAREACADLAPGGTSSGGGQASDQLLRFSECMRANGVPQFPDPQAGGLAIGADSGIDPNSPEFQTAVQACQTLLPAR